VYGVLGQRDAMLHLPIIEVNGMQLWYFTNGKLARNGLWPGLLLAVRVIR
jgi:hypothetical protein